MKNLTILLTLTIALTGCLKKREPMKHEKGFVVEKQYIPDTRQTITGTGINTRGELEITTHEIGDSEKYITILKCEHNVIFSMNKPNLFGKLNRGDTVQIDYYELVNDKGEVKDFDFVDANKVNL